MDQQLHDFPVQAMIAVSDIDRAKQFYGGILELAAGAENGAGVAYSSGTSVVFVYVSTHAGTNQATSVSWNIENIDAIVKGLADKGVEFKTYDYPGSRVENFVHTLGDTEDAPKAAWFTDPDGNILGLSSL